MLEEQLLGGLLPSHPDYEPFIQAIRTKYGLAEIFPQDDPIEEIYLDDEIISLEKFSEDIRNQVLGNMENLFSEDFAKKYESAKQAIEMDVQKEIEKIPDELRPMMEMFFEYTKNTAQTVYQLLDAQVDEVVQIICNNLLLGDSKDAPEDWLGKVITTNSEGDTIIIAVISEVTNLDFIFQQIRDVHKKSFGKRQVKLTKITASTAYYLQLLIRNKDRDFILDEFIRLNKFKLPNKRSPQYVQVRNMYWQRLRKRLEKAKMIANTIVREKK